MDEECFISIFSIKLQTDKLHIRILPSSLSLFDFSHFVIMICSFVSTKMVRWEMILKQKVKKKWKVKKWLKDCKP